MRGAGHLHGLSADGSGRGELMGASGVGQSEGLGLEGEPAVQHDGVARLGIALRVVVAVVCSAALAAGEG